MFQERFAPLVGAGRKLQTIRKVARCRKGDLLSLRCWSGKPYRSRQRILAEATCSAVVPVEIHQCDCTVDGKSYPPQHLALEDGFASWKEMRDWFEKTHGLPFRGELIQWNSADLCTPVTPAPSTTESDGRCAVCRQRNSYAGKRKLDDGSYILWYCNVPGCSNAEASAKTVPQPSSCHGGAHGRG